MLLLGGDVALWVLQMGLHGLESPWNLAQGQGGVWGFLGKFVQVTSVRATD